MLIYNIIVISLCDEIKFFNKVDREGRMGIGKRWELVRTKGSHHHFKHQQHKGIVTIPHPKKDIPIGTVNAILKQAGLK